MSFDLREALNAIFMKEKYAVPADYSQFAINQYLAKYRQNIPILDKIMCLKLTNEAHFRYLKKKVGWGWPLKVANVEIKKDTLKECIMRYYDCSRLDAESYIKFMSKSEKESIEAFYEGD